MYTTMNPIMPQNLLQSNTPQMQPMLPNYIYSNNQPNIIQYNIYPQNINQINMNQNNIQNMNYRNTNNTLYGELINKNNILNQYGKNTNYLNNNSGYQNINLNNNKIIPQTQIQQPQQIELNNIEIKKIEDTYNQLINSLQKDIKGYQKKLDDINELKNGINNLKYLFDKYMLKTYQDIKSYRYPKFNGDWALNKYNRVEEFENDEQINCNLSIESKNILRELKKQKDETIEEFINRCRKEADVQLENEQNLINYINICKGKIKSYEEEKLQAKSSLLEKMKTNVVNNAYY